ncbi:uncharacterized protein LOC129592490 [Paramacrobiotus metropolitanus]|uniref:uncharacterized protein LOC129592490 n=1 Tax=Paramacrobiotus metropolitanus TaxID=2943436 RepID=UPI002445E2E6|nr:uncharacterized protein LOC129592490 [Paramacrobiotus metropolitanus]XP_055344511.1 uncharacterized protein LOC129592490 [Paramacrobiotus metropolitanus]
MPRGKAIDPDLVKTVYRLYAQFKSYSKVGELCGKHKSWVGRVMQHYDQSTGLQKTAHPRGRATIITPEKERELEAFFQENPDISNRKAEVVVGVKRGTLGGWRRKRSKQQRKVKAAANKPAPKKSSTAS